MLFESLGSKFYRLVLLSVSLYGCWKIYQTVRSYGDVNIKRNEKELQLMISSLQDYHISNNNKQKSITERVKYADELLSQFTFFLKKGNSKELSKLIQDYSLLIYIFIDNHILQDNKSTRMELKRGDELIERLNEINIIFRDMASRH